MLNKYTKADIIETIDLLKEIFHLEPIDKNWKKQTKPDLV
jgi:hypothetical protein